MARRLLILVTDLEIGGTPGVVRELATRLRRPGLHVEVASLKTVGPVGGPLLAAGVDVTAFDANTAFSLPAVAWRLRRLIRARAIDTVYSLLVHSNVVAAIGVPRSVRLIQSVQTAQSYPAWHWRAQRWAARRARRVIVPSPSVADAAAARSFIPRVKIVIIPNAIDPNAYTRSPVPADPPTPFPLGFIGRLDPVKRVPDLVAAVARLGPGRVTLHVYGDGPDRRRIEAAVATSGATNVFLHGFTQNVKAVFATLGLLVLPSEAEGLSVVLIEAMASGVPVVATDAPGIRDCVVHDVNGLLVPVGDPARLAESIARVVDDAGLRARLVESGLRTVREQYAWDRVRPRYDDALFGDGPR